MGNRRQHRDLRSEFEKRFAVDATTGCWVWTGNKFIRGGYACFTCRPLDIFMARANRVSWELYRHPLDGPHVHVLHHCDNPLCVNPDHLFLGDHTTNMADKLDKGRQSRGDQHGMSKLTERQALLIIVDERYLAEIAAEYAVSPTTISDIKRGRSWSHLDRSKAFRRGRGKR